MLEEEIERQRLGLGRRRKKGTEEAAGLPESHDSSVLIMFSFLFSCFEACCLFSSHIQAHPFECIYWQDGGDGTDEVESWRQMIGVLEELEAPVVRAT